MSKKKNQHKGKPKHATEQNQDVIFKEKHVEESDEEYTTVVDLDNKKFTKRLIKNNWSKYESTPVDFDVEDEEPEYPKTDDFTHLLKNASSDCSHFQFNSEKQWKSENYTVPSSQIFNLDLNVLSNGLACVPFYERIGLSENELTAEEKEMFDREAEINRKNYYASMKPVEESKDLNTEILDVSEKKESEVKVEEKEDKKVKEKPEIKMIFKENEENLEDWLDSVLDD